VATEPRPERRYHVTALERGLAILDCFVQGPPELMLIEIATRVGLNKATAFRLIQTLQSSGYVQQDPITKRYSLSLKVLDLQTAGLMALRFPQVAQPLLEDLSHRIHESSSMAVLEGQWIRYVARAAAPRIMTDTLQVGSRLPAHATSMGKLLLAARGEAWVRDLYRDEALTARSPRTLTSLDVLLDNLEEVSRRGYAIADEELELGHRSASAPVFDSTGTVIAAVNISTATGRVSLSQFLDTMIPELIDTARRISRLLGNNQILQMPPFRERPSDGAAATTALPLSRGKR
jgi:IclR family pca regulon transcriptional regulator